MANPQMTVIETREDAAGAYSRVVVEGPVEREDWTGFADARGNGRMEFCYRHSTSQLIRFGGTVWPGAWPSLFVFEYRNSREKCTFLTTLAQAKLCNQVTQ